MFNNPLIQLLFVALLSFGVLSMLLKLVGPVPVLVLVAVAILFGIVSWMVRHRTSQIAKYYKYAGCKQFIDLVCWVNKLQAPVASKNKKQQIQDQLLLKDPLDFHRAGEKLQKLIRGHDEEIEQIFNRLQDDLSLRKTSTRKNDRPISIIVLCGQPGIGKRTLATGVGHLLYRSKATTCFSMSQFQTAQAAQSLFGSDTVSGLIAQPVKAKPFHTIILDDIEQADPAVINGLASLFSTGVQSDKASKSSVSFQHCVFFVLTTRGAKELIKARENTTGKRNWIRKAEDILGSLTGIDQAFLSSASDYIVLPNLSPLEKAEAVALMIAKECRKHEIELQYVSPELLATEVNAISDQVGLKYCKTRIEKLVRDPLLRATRRKQKTISLRADQITLVQ